MRVPQLRFKEFTQPWFAVTIGEVGEVITGSTPSTAEPAYYNGDKFFVSPVDISSERYISNTKTTLSEAGFKKGRLVKANSILFVCIGSTIGKLAQNKVDCVTNQQINAIVPSKNYHSGFIYSRLEKDAKKISLLAGEQAVPILNKTSFSKVAIHVSTFPEQTKIANFLTAVDEIISRLTRKHDLLTQYKKGVMQQIFSQALRFKDEDGREFPEWEKRAIDDEIDFLSGYPFDGDEISENSLGVPLMRGINITEGFIRHSTIIDRYYLGDCTKLQKYRLQVNDLVIGMDGSKVGKNSALVSECDKGSLLVQRVARLRARTSSSIGFLYQHIISNKFHIYVDTVNTSSGIPHISAKQIKEFEIFFPIIEEQTKIANFLAAIDDKITVTKTQLAAVKQYKQGLLQQMFV